MFKCPQCHSKKLQVVVSVWAALSQDDGNFSTEPDNVTDKSHTWDGDAVMQCLSCDHIAQARFFKKWSPSSHWDDHPDYPTEDWTDEIINGATRQGYIDWVNSQIERA